MSVKRWLIILLPVVILLAGTYAAWLAFAPYRDLDLLIVNGTVVDGAGGEPYIGDIGIRDEKIVGISRWRFYFSKPKVKIDAMRRIVSPGFIDVHTHVEPNIPNSGAFTPANFLRQGVTTLITGNCGRSLVDVGEFFKRLEKNGTHINVATLIGHNSVRRAVMGNASHPPTPEEMRRMVRLVDRAMDDGALGLSTGLAYVPGRFASRAEVIELNKAVAEYGGIYASHIRDEARGGVEAIAEALEIGKAGGTATQISHFKCSGPLQWNTAAERLRLVERAQAIGQSVHIDIYPYDHSSTTTDVLLPDWAVGDERRGLRDVAANPETRRRLHLDILKKLKLDGWSDLTHITLAAGKTEWIGKTLAEVPTPTSDLGQQIENLIEVSLRGGAQAIYGDMKEADVEQIITASYGVFGSDSAVRNPSAAYKPHPRGCGTFPRIFRVYVKEKKLLTVSQAVQKATGEAAEIFGLQDRGFLREGAWADIVIFDPDQIADIADYEHPFDEPSGIDYVIVNGVITVDHGSLTSATSCPGRALRHNESLGEFAHASGFHQKEN
jgi:N-acyl-D-amino-acid deacylase